MLQLRGPGRGPGSPPGLGHVLGSRRGGATSALFPVLTSLSPSRWVGTGERGWSRGRAHGHASVCMVSLGVRFLRFVCGTGRCLSRLPCVSAFVGRDGCVRDGCEVRLRDLCVRVSRVSLVMCVLAYRYCTGSCGRAGAGVLVGLDGCEVLLCDPCARARPFVPCVWSRLPRCLFTGTGSPVQYRCVSRLPRVFLPVPS